MNDNLLSELRGKKVNMHSHTTRCQHAVGEDREYVEMAIEAGFEVLGFSDHAPYIFKDKNYVSPMRMRPDELEGYVYSVESLKKEYEKDITLYVGLEMEYFPELFDKTLEFYDDYPLEYLILGQHFFDSEEGWHGTTDEWPDEKHLKMYTERVIQGLSYNKFLYVAHPDVLNFTGPEDVYIKYANILLDELKRRNMPVEVNVNGVRGKRHYTSRRFVDLAVKNGNEFIIGVDSHDPKQLLDFDAYLASKQMVLDAGGKVICSLL